MRRAITLSYLLVHLHFYLVHSFHSDAFHRYSGGEIFGCLLVVSFHIRHSSLPSLLHSCFKGRLHRFVKTSATFCKFRKNVPSFRNFVVVFASFSKFSDVFGLVWTWSHLFGWVWMHSDASGRVQKRSDLSENFELFPKKANRNLGCLFVF